MNERDSHYRVPVHALRVVNTGIQSRKRRREGEEQEVVKSSLFPRGHSWQDTEAQDSTYSGINEALPL